MNYNKNILALATAVCLFVPEVVFAAKQGVIQQKSANDPIVEINFADLQLSEFVKMVAKIPGKNILLSVDVPGKVDFISQKSIRQSELFDLLINVLETKGFTIIDSQKGYLKVVPSATSLQRIKSCVPFTIFGSFGCLLLTIYLYSHHLHRHPARDRLS